MVGFTTAIVRRCCSVAAATIAWPSMTQIAYRGGHDTLAIDIDHHRNSEARVNCTLDAGHCEPCGRRASWMLRLLSASVSEDTVCTIQGPLLTLLEAYPFSWKIVSQASAEDVFRFTGNETHTDYFRLVLRDGNYLLVGGRNLVHNLSLTDLTEQQRLTWYSTEKDVKMCVVKGTPEENCQNYIRILVKTELNTLLVCATNAFKPMCREYEVQPGNYSIVKEKGGQAKCPYDPRHNSTFVYVDGELYTGTVADFAGMDPIIYREPLQTEQYDSMSLNAPNFVSSMSQGDFVYFFFRETAVEYINCGKVNNYSESHSPTNYFTRHFGKCLLARPLRRCQNWIPCEFPGETVRED
ncbi:hypothetical protein KM043_004594 [Ampulex compressa]|nr:hypothetical protein KM043_004594 [Ampulex compressa]